MKIDSRKQQQVIRKFKFIVEGISADEMRQYVLDNLPKESLILESVKDKSIFYLEEATKHELEINPSLKELLLKLYIMLNPDELKRQAEKAGLNDEQCLKEILISNIPKYIQNVSFLYKMAGKA